MSKFIYGIASGVIASLFWNTFIPESTQNGGVTKPLSIRTTRRIRVEHIPIWEIRDDKKVMTQKAKQTIQQIVKSLPGAHIHYKKENVETELLRELKKKKGVTTMEKRISKPGDFELCTGLNDYYVEEQLYNNDDLFVLYAGKPNKNKTYAIRGRIRGFGLVKRKKKSVEIDVLCAINGGRDIVQSIENFGRKIGKKFIELYALTNVIEYYTKKLNFKVMVDNGKYSMSTARLIQKIYDSQPDKTSKLTSLVENHVNKQFIGQHPIGCVQEQYTTYNNTSKKKYNLAKCSESGYRMIKSLVSENYDEKYNSVFQRPTTKTISKVKGTQSLSLFSSQYLKH